MRVKHASNMKRRLMIEELRPHSSFLGKLAKSAASAKELRRTTVKMLVVAEE